MKIKVSEASGRVLDWMVATIEGHQYRYSWMLEKDGYASWMSYEQAWGNPHPSYSTDWSRGGPIIEREGINLNYNGFDVPPYWEAYSEMSGRIGAWHTTPLIAAMRCYAAMKLGDEVDVPDELLS